MHAIECLFDYLWKLDISGKRCGLVALNVTIKSYSTIVKFWENMIINL